MKSWRILTALFHIPLRNPNNTPLREKEALRILKTKIYQTKVTNQRTELLLRIIVATWATVALSFLSIH